MYFVFGYTVCSYRIKMRAKGDFRISDLVKNPGGTDI